MNSILLELEFDFVTEFFLGSVVKSCVKLFKKSKAFKLSSIFSNLFSARSVAPIVTQLHSRAGTIRNSELQKLSRKFPELTPEQLKGVETLTTAITNKLMHEPTVRLKDAAGTPKGERLSEALQDLFDL